jgi:transaldolase
MMTKLHEAARLGQSIWLDYIRRSFIKSGQLQTLIDAGLRGITSNPSIFNEAISQSDDYDAALQALVSAGKSLDEIYEALVVEDIQQAADLLRPIYDETSGHDGYISLEVSPRLAYDTENTIKEVRHLHKVVNRPNLMIKVPATAAGIPAIATLIGEGININVTLMFSLKDYEAVADAYLRGLERLAGQGGDLNRVASVASFFVSRVDGVVDKQLDTISGDRADLARTLKSAIGIANAKLAYVRYLSVFSSERWQRLAALGARPQRVLWGSTSTKSPDLPDTLYADNLMGANTVNTLPPATLDAFRDHGTVASGLTTNLDQAREQLVQLAKLGINLEIITQQLQDEGVQKFSDAFEALMKSIDMKCRELSSQSVAAG